MNAECEWFRVEVEYRLKAYRNGVRYSMPGDRKQHRNLLDQCDANVGQYMHVLGIVGLPT